MNAILSKAIKMALLCFALFGSLVISTHALAQDIVASSAVVNVAEVQIYQAQVSDPVDQQAGATQQNNSSRRLRGQHRVNDGTEIVTMGDNSQLLAGEQANTVVSIFGSSTSEGEVSGEVVSIMGNTHVTGPIGGDAVAIIGNVYVNNKVNGEVVAVFGNVELGPQADVRGKVVVVGGTLKRDAAAKVHDSVQQVGKGFESMSFAWLQPWIDQCLKYARPLAIGPGLAWAWVVAIVSLLSYVLTAWLAPRSVRRCVETLEHHAGASLLAALAGMVLTPVLMILLFITMIGILAIPFVGIALFCIGMFGKLVMLAWLGRRLMRGSSDPVLGNMSMATLIGGLLVTLLYLVPVLGLAVYKLLGFVGYGVVLYTLLLAFRQRLPASVTPQGGALPRHQSVFTASAATESVTAQAATPPSNTNNLELPRATFWVRMGALMIDAMLILFVLKLVSIDDIFLPILALYGGLMWKFKGTTIGGLVFHLHVVRVDGRVMDWQTVVVRALSCLLSLLPAGFGFIWIAIDDGKQSWHDKIAGTIVLRIPKSGSSV